MKKLDQHESCIICNQTRADGHLEDVLEVGVAEVSNNLGVGSSYCRRESEGVNSPLQVAAPPILLQWQPLAQCRFVYLHNK